MSLDLTGLHLRLENEFGIQLPQTPIEEIKWEIDPTVRELVDYISKLVAMQNPEQNCRVFERVRSAISRELNIPPSEITMDSHLIRDLRMN